MQRYECHICKKDALGGGSKIYGGMFLKLCPECMDDDEAIRKLDESWDKIDEEEEGGNLVT